MLVALVITVILGSLLWVPQGRFLDWRVYDYLSTLWPPEAAPKPVLVAIDEPSFAEINKPWPWPRGLHGQLIQSLRAAGAKVIGLDLVFDVPPDAEQDRLLELALAPEVVLASTEEKVEPPQIEQYNRVRRLQISLDPGAEAGTAAFSRMMMASCAGCPSVKAPLPR